MPDAVIEITGLEELQRSLRLSNAQMGKALHDGLQAAGVLVRAEAQERVPVVTGKLSRAIRPGPVEGVGLNQSIAVGIAPGMGSPSKGPSIKGQTRKERAAMPWNTSDPQVYGPVVERGSGPHVIKPVRAKVLAFTVGGEQVFAASVNHPGTPAKPFLVPALTENADRINRLIRARFDAVLATFGRR